MKNIVNTINCVVERFYLFAISGNNFEIDVFNPFEVGFLSDETGNRMTSPGEFFA
jgi:hypothetical protein